MVDDHRELRILFVRHGQSVNNYNNSNYASAVTRALLSVTSPLTKVYDAPLTSLGRRQATAIGTFIKNYHLPYTRQNNSIQNSLKDIHLDTIYTSDMTRAIETGICMAREIGAGSVTPLPFFNTLLYPARIILGINI